MAAACADRPCSCLLAQCFEAGDAATYAAGVREAAVWAAAGRHPNLRALLDAFEHRSAAGRHAVLVAQALDGTPLAEVSRWRLLASGCVDGALANGPVQTGNSLPSHFDFVLRVLCAAPLELRLRTSTSVGW
jgi:hypothetical protein